MRWCCLLAVLVALAWTDQAGAQYFNGGQQFANPQPFFGQPGLPARIDVQLQPGTLPPIITEERWRLVCGPDGCRLVPVQGSFSVQNWNGQQWQPGWPPQWQQPWGGQGQWAGGQPWGGQTWNSGPPGTWSGPQQ